MEAGREDTAQERLTEAERHAITVVALAFSFALIAIGFSLFVMGIQRAFNMHAGSSDFGTLVIKTTSPGLLCILAATVLIGIALVSQMPASTDLVSEGKARVLGAEAQAKEREADARSEQIRAEADAYRDKANADAELARLRAEAHEREIDAKVRLLEAGASPELIEALERTSATTRTRVRQQTESPASTSK